MAKSFKARRLRFADIALVQDTIKANELMAAKAANKAANASNKAAKAAIKVKQDRAASLAAIAAPKQHALSTIAGVTSIADMRLLLLQNHKISTPESISMTDSHVWAFFKILHSKKGNKLFVPRAGKVNARVLQNTVGFSTDSNRVTLYKGA